MAMKGLLMRFGFAPIRGSNPRASAPDQALRRTGVVPGSLSLIINASCSAKCWAKCWSLRVRSPGMRTCSIAAIRLPALVLGARTRDRPSRISELAGNLGQPSVQIDVDPPQGQRR